MLECLAQKLHCRPTIDDIANTVARVTGNRAWLEVDNPSEILTKAAAIAVGC